MFKLAEYTMEYLGKKINRAVAKQDMTGKLCAVYRSSHEQKIEPVIYGRIFQKTKWKSF